MKLAPLECMCDHGVTDINTRLKNATKNRHLCPLAAPRMHIAKGMSLGPIGVSFCSLTKHGSPPSNGDPATVIIKGYEFGL